MKKDKYLKIPHNCYLILTSKCNMRCRHCYGDYGNQVPTRELTGNEWIKIIEDLSKNGIFFVNISGGEPTVHPDFIKIINSLVNNEIYFMLTTNGVFNDNVLNAIINAKEYILGVQISLDGADWETHGYLRRDINGKMKKSIFDKTIYTIEQLIKNKIRVSLATCLHKENIEKIDDLKRLVINLSPNNWSISTISISGRAKDNLSLYVSERKHSIEYWDKLKKECLDNNITVEFIDMPSLVKDKSSSKIYYECPASKWFCEINSDGITTPCPLARVNSPKDKIIWDNIKEKSIEEIWNGTPFNAFRKYQQTGCSGCNVKDKCDRCPPQSIQWFNDPLMPPPYCIENGKNLELDDLENLQRKLEQAKIENNRQDYSIME